VLAPKNFKNLWEHDVTAILQQLGLDSTFYTEFAVFFVLFLFLGQIFFKPFLALFEERHRKTVQAKEEAAAMTASAQAKLEEYQAKLHEARVEARKAIDETLLAAKTEESKLLAAARDEAKKLTQQVSVEIEAERSRIQGQLQRDAESLATAIAETLLVRKS